MDYLDELESEEDFERELLQISQMVTVVEKWGYGFRTFKEVIRPHLSIHLDEDGMVDAFQCWVLQINPDRPESPIGWARFHFDKFWITRNDNQ